VRNIHDSFASQPLPATSSQGMGMVGVGERGRGKVEG
jgi:hypothetical protein